MKGVFVVLMCLAFVANSGCKTFETFEAGLHPKSPEQKKQEERQAWIEEKSVEVANKLSGLYPIVHQSRVQKLSADEYEELKAVYTKVSEEEFEVKDYASKKSLAELRQGYDEMLLTIKVFQRTRAYINAQFEEAAYLSSNEDEYYMFHSYPMLDKTPVEAVKEMFYSEHPQYSEYVSWLSAIEEEFKQVSNQISNYGLQKEKEKFLQRARKSGCPEVSEFNFWGNNMSLSRGVAYGVSKPEAAKIYDLAGFKVLQSM